MPLSRKTNYLYEGLEDFSTARTMMLWESAGNQLREAALTADQIQQIFQAAEQGATDTGSNRTMLGKGKDAAEAVNKAWEDLKTKIQNSAPISAVDKKYDDAVAKIEAGLGGPDNAVNQVIQKYRAFAKEHPVAQGFIYAALIAAAGISGAGLGGAAVLGLLKMADKLLQGEKFSSAAYSGAKTGAMAYGASKLGDYIKGAKQSADVAGEPVLPVQGTGADAANVGNLTKGLNPEQLSHLTNLGKQGATAIVKDGRVWVQMQDGALQMLKAPSGVSPEAMLKIINSAAGTESRVIRGKKLSEGQVYMIFNRVTAEVIMEGPMDAIKGAIGKGVDKLKTAGHNLTTKVTADKLNKAWQAAGSPLDSAEVAKILTANGVDKSVVKKVYTDLQIPAGKDSAKSSTVSFEKVMAMVNKLPTDRKVRLLTFLSKKGTSTAAPVKATPQPDPQGRIEPTM